MIPLPDRPHRRYNPLLDEWVLVSPQRLARPWLGQVEAAADEPLPAYDPTCYLCPGNARAGGTRNPAYTGTYAFDNDYPALVAGRGAHGVADDDLLVVAPVEGACRVLCFSPRHDLALPRLTVDAIVRVVDAWADETRTLGERPGVRYVQVFENKGAAMGCSNPHPHAQVWASTAVPTIPARKLVTQQRHFERHGRDLVGDCLEREVADGRRVVCENDTWVAVVPFWAVWPFETMLVPRRRVPDLPALTHRERRQLAEVLKQLTVRYDNLFQCAFPYSMGWHGRPTDGHEHPWWRLHAVCCPPLLRSATVRKFLVGYELTAEPQRDLTAEDAAARLRAQSGRHYLEER